MRNMNVKSVLAQDSKAENDDTFEKGVFHL